MSIYAKLADVLAARGGSSWKVTFPDLERLIGAKLPASAFKYPAWWSNNPSNNAMTKIWLNAGWRTEQVDIPGQSVVFRRAAVSQEASRAGLGDRPRAFEYASTRAPETKMAASGQPHQAKEHRGVERDDGKAPFERLYGCLKGVIRAAREEDPAGVDLRGAAWGDKESLASNEKWDRLLPGRNPRA